MRVFAFLFRTSNNMGYEILSRAVISYGCIGRILSLSRALGGRITAVRHYLRGVFVPLPPYSTFSRGGPGSREVA